MIEYQFKDIESNKEPECENYDFNGKFEHLWWLFNDVDDVQKCGKYIIRENDALIIPSYTYTSIYENCCKEAFDDWLDCGSEVTFRDIAQVGFYETFLKCIIGVHFKIMQSTLLFLEIHEVYNCPALKSIDIKKVYIVKVKLSKIKSYQDSLQLGNMAENITIHDNQQVFRVYEDCLACTPTDCPYFANAFEYVIKKGNDIWCVEKDVPFIVVNDDDITISHTGKVLPNVNYHGLMNKIKKVLSDIE